jgi:hypothetical protein
MNIEIDVSAKTISSGDYKGQVLNCANWDPAFMEKIHEWYNRNHEGNTPGAGFHILAKGHFALIDAIEEILGEKQDELTVTLRFKRE